MINILRDWRDMLNWKDFEELVVFLWSLWNRRNAFVFNKRRVEDDDLAGWVSTYIATFKATNTNHATANQDVSQSFQQSSQIHQAQNHTIWCPAEEGVFKLKTDASFSSIDFNAGLGVIIIRDHRGQVLASATKYLEHVASVDDAEALAAVEGLRVAMETGISPILLETDSLRIYNLFARDKEGLSKTGSIIEYVKTHLATRLQVSYSFTKRTGNTIAHLLARRALQSQENFV
ncbi:uncharacterized protein LOC111010533 [Momordica charantia]|uniref:Uncharacterized protein LOC111010533 n=1 Tax=Momordica charantia TaxID=3673 RepID=A0A6J1CDQ4_MOMCH|nr:uncharacterized protein LOC111010533 [Momordica charantia]